MTTRLDAVRSRLTRRITHRHDVLHRGKARAAAEQRLCFGSLRVRLPTARHLSLSWMPATETMQLFTQHSACSFDGIRASALPDLLCSTPAVVGAAIFAVGTRHQAKCHSILAELKAARQSGSRARYGVPRGDWFEFSSCAHYLVRVPRMPT